MKIPHEPLPAAVSFLGSVLLHALLLAWLPPLRPAAVQAAPTSFSPLVVQLVDSGKTTSLPPDPAPTTAGRAGPVPGSPRAVPVAKVLPAPLPQSAPSTSAPEATAAPAAKEAAPTPAAALPLAALTPATRKETETAMETTPPDLRAAYASNPPPSYPLAARRLGLEGRVVLWVEIRADGSCGEVRVRQTAGHPLLDEAAAAAVKRWRFLPARRGGEPVTTWAEVPIRFRLTGSSTDPDG